MRVILIIISVIGLLVTIVPSFLVFMDIISLENNKLLLMVGTMIWFLSAPFWMNKKIK